MKKININKGTIIKGLKKFAVLTAVGLAGGVAGYFIGKESGKEAADNSNVVDFTDYTGESTFDESVITEE